MYELAYIQPPEKLGWAVPHSKFLSQRKTRLRRQYPARVYTTLVVLVFIRNTLIFLIFQERYNTIAVLLFFILFFSWFCSSNLLIDIFNFDYLSTVVSVFILFVDLSCSFNLLINIKSVMWVVSVEGITILLIFLLLGGSNSDNNDLCCSSTYSSGSPPSVSSSSVSPQSSGTLFFFYKKLFYKKVTLIFTEKLRNP